MIQLYLEDTHWSYRNDVDKLRIAAKFKTILWFGIARLPFLDAPGGFERGNQPVWHVANNRPIPP
jgi:hypothetical protein